MRRLVTLFCLGGIVTGAGCGEPFAIQAAGGSGGSGSTTTAAGAAGGGAAGSGGKAPACTPASCGDGEYCDHATGTCVTCAGSTTFHFSDQVVDLGVTPPVGTTAFSPRVDADDGSLDFTCVDKSSSMLPRRRLASAPPKGALAWGPATLLPPPINSAGQESGPLFLHDASMLNMLVDPQKVDTDRPVLLFDSSRDNTLRPFAANLDGVEVSEVGLPTNKRDTDLAAAPLASPPRFYWMSDEGNTAQQHLVTATASSAATPVTIRLENGCQTGNISAPWVTPDGQFLFFASSLTSTACTVQPLARYLYVARMDGAGQQASGDMAQRVFPDVEKTYDDTPALTPDACVLLFARFDASTNGHLMGALRD